MVILNFSDKEQTIAVKDKTLFGNPMNVFAGKNESLTGEPRKIGAWGYIIYEYKPGK